MGKKTAKNPFGGNPFGAPSLPFNLPMGDPFAGAKDFDEVLGLKKKSSFDEIGDGFDGSSFNGIPQGRKKSRRKRLSIERQQRLSSGQEALTPQEEYNFNEGNQDIFGDPRTQ